MDAFQNAEIMPITFWIIFNAAMLVLVFLDMGVWNRGGRVMPCKTEILASAVAMASELGFELLVHRWMGPGKSLEFITGYLIEEALSVDNLFIFILIFSYFKVPPEQERTVLFWGILGALIMRGLFIVGGVALVGRFHWVLYGFGAFLVYSGFQLARQSEDKQVDPARNVALRLARNFLPVSQDYDGNKFFTLREGKRFATPLFIVLLVVETTDVLFATDSIPAVLAITRDTFIVYTSNVFAVLGLRSLYFALSGMMKLFHHLHYGLAVVLMFIGAKMVASIRYEIPTWVALAVIAGVLAISVLASVIFPQKRAA